MPPRGRTTQQLLAALAAEGTRPNYDHYKQDNDNGRWRAAAAAWVESWGGRDAPARPGPAWTSWWGTQKKQHAVLLAAAREQGVEPNAGDAAAAEERAAAAAAEAERAAAAAAEAERAAAEVERAVAAAEMAVDAAPPSPAPLGERPAAAHNAGASAASAEARSTAAGCEGETAMGRYLGEYNAAGEFEGCGVFRYANGDVYEGEWKAGLPEGRGVFWYTEGNVESGFYQQNADVGAASANEGSEVEADG